MKRFKALVLAAVMALAASPAKAALTAGGAAALDGSGNERTSFTNVETIALRQRVSNSAASESMILFKFTVYNPSGGAVFHHEGNSAKATLGNSNSQISGLAIATFYSVPGIYKFRAEAVLDGQTITQDVDFQISSPNINLIYPPYGSRGLTDSPLIFRWVASGAARYKITIAKDAGLAQELHTAETSAAMYTIPDELSSTEKMVADTVYYWKVEGLDATGGKIAESTVYSFSLKSQASSQTRNVAVTLVDLTETANDFTKPLMFRAIVQNTGGTSESNVSLKFTLGGIPAQDSPKSLGMLTAGETRTFNFTAFMPTGQEEGLAVACVDLFDDNIPDNCKTKFIAKASGFGAATEGTQETRNLSYQEIWEAVLKRLGPDVAGALEDYTFETIECSNCASGELNDIMLALLEGDASLTGAAVGDSYQPAGEALAAAEEDLEPELDESPEFDMELMAGREKDREWSGYTTAVKSKNPFFYKVRGKRAWEKTWKMLSTDEVPKVDFKEKTVIGIIAGTGNKADTVRIISRKQQGETTVFEYYMTESAGENPGVPYIFRTFDLVGGKVHFKRLDKGK